MILNQRTLARETSVSGIGLHTGHKVSVVFKPASAGDGITFIRTDLPGKPLIRLGSMEVVHGGDAGRYSAIKKDEVIIYTIEHLLSVLAALGIDNVTIEMDADEPPGLDPPVGNGRRARPARLGGGG